MRVDLLSDAGTCGPRLWACVATAAPERGRSLSPSRTGPAPLGAPVRIPAATGTVISRRAPPSGNFRAAVHSGCFYLCECAVIATTQLV
eukprot:scaffold99390_cov31-Tisochrysis_lutea.AAC.1